MATAAVPDSGVDLSIGFASVAHPLAIVASAPIAQAHAPESASPSIRRICGTHCAAMSP
jgi:hypothetical protein